MSKMTMKMLQMHCKMVDLLQTIWILVAFNVLFDGRQ